MVGHIHDQIDDGVSSRGCNPLTSTHLTANSSPTSIGVCRAVAGPEGRFRLCRSCHSPTSTLANSTSRFGAPFERSHLSETLLLKFYIASRLLLQRIGPGCRFGHFDRATDPVFAFSRCCTPRSSKQRSHKHNLPATLTPARRAVETLHPTISSPSPRSNFTSRLGAIPRAHLRPSASVCVHTWMQLVIYLLRPRASRPGSAPLFAAETGR